ncbi:class F sortase [Nonomuraea gerenzanensis]|uniref:Putative secreted protein n=1 Tax=Nonomuraea gerenzanensis TaxID=93944 RepID=A0A1M4EKL0_9ACTN|nr:class F sortase [Nonomuraea gerenzanensis]UBU10683.1 class F sortase [Nonomuraea gerenzanensis]SBO99103.1 putative secreted protein [Nonomuraea gerenzanensis]
MANRLLLGVAVAVSMAGVLLIGLGLSGALGGGGDTATAPAAQQSRPATAPLKDLPGVPPSKVAEPMRAARPTAVYIPSIGVAAPLMELGLDAEGAIQNPPFDPPNLAGWYRYGPVPGQRGAAVITGHLDTRTGPAVFARLKDVRRGAQIQVLRADRSVAVFVVDKVEHTPKRGFPAKKVYGKLRYPGLRLVTCGGAFDQRAHSYEENTIVYAHLAAPYHPRS